MKTTRSVVVIYEDAGAQQTAVAFCDCLLQRFSAEEGFDVSWWPFDRLQMAENAETATRKAAEAEIVVFASRTGGTFPAFMQAWTERWIAERQELEGALVGLYVSDSDAAGTSDEFHNYLRRVAHRAGMDFLTEVPQQIAHLVPESPESCSARAHQHTNVLDTILHQSPPPLHSSG